MRSNAVYSPRGIDSIRSHMFDDSLSTETFGYVVSHSFKSQKLKVMTCEDLRWQRCDIKSTSLLGNVMSMNNARMSGCHGSHSFLHCSYSLRFLIMK